jgi:hypothetical protein
MLANPTISALDFVAAAAKAKEGTPLENHDTEILSIGEICGYLSNPHPFNHIKPKKVGIFTPSHLLSLNHREKFETGEAAHRTAPQPFSFEEFTRNP